MSEFLVEYGPSFDPETNVVLGQALDRAWSIVAKSPKPLQTVLGRPITRELIARRIIRLARQGERDPAVLGERALAGLLGVSYPFKR